TAFAAGPAASVAVPPRAVALAKGVLNTMLMTQRQAALTLAAVSLLGAGALTGLAPAPQPPAASARPPASIPHHAGARPNHLVAIHGFLLGLLNNVHSGAQTRLRGALVSLAHHVGHDDPVEADKEKLQGTWTIVSWVHNGVEQKDTDLFRVVFDGGSFT